MVSIIIPNYNGADYLPACLDALAEQSFRDAEVIVADNTSTDGSADLVERSYPATRLLRLDKNRGFAAAVNAGVKASEREFIIILNSDTRAEPDFVAELHAALEAEPGAAMAAPKMLFARDTTIINSMGLGYDITGTNHDIGFGLADGPQFDEGKWIFGPCGGAGMYRRSIFREIGPLDEDYFMYYEDVDLAFRAQMAGHKCIFVPSARVYHIEGAGTDTLPRRRNYYLARNALTVIAKNFPRSLLIRYCHVLFWEILKRVGSPALKGDFSALSGYFSALWRLGEILEKRAAIQRLKKASDDDIEAILIENRSVLKAINLQGRPPIRDVGEES